MKTISEFQLAQSIDQTNLNPLLSCDEFILFLEKSRELKFASVAILPIYTKLAKEVLEGSQTKVTIAISYPLGGVPANLKAKEVEYAIKDGADEIDYVVNMAAIKTGEYKKVLDEVRMIISAAESKPVKAIIEMWNLNEDEIRKTCETILEANVSFIKSSTAFKGYKKMRAGTIEDALLLKKIVHNRAKIKIAGGINNIQLTLELLALGVNRIGTSSGVQILTSYRDLN
jgi:deoxyribose-phosphate aldolase